MHIERFVVSPFQSNCYILSTSQDPGAEAVIIDPGDTRLDTVFSAIEERNLKVSAVWLTHAHLDHIMGVDVVRSRYNVPAYLHTDDVVVWNGLPESVQRFFGQACNPLAPPDGLWNDGDVISLGDEKFTILHTPGHSPGSVCFVQDRIVFTGDTLFKQSIGRVDLPYSDPQQMQKSLRRLLESIKDDAMLYPGHMGSTTMAEERSTIPNFIQMLDS